MAGPRLSRRRIAAYFADELVAGRDVTGPLAAYLVETRRTREYELIVRDIEAALAQRGTLIANVVSARELAADTRKTITDYLKQRSGVASVEIRSNVDPYLLGGVRIETPGQRLDATLRHKLNQLTASKI